MIVSFFLALHNGMESIFKMQIQVQVKRFNLYIVLVITLVKPEETDFSKCKAKKKNGMWIHPMRCVFKGLDSIFLWMTKFSIKVNLTPKFLTRL